jgi:uncharacterized protein YbbC (DUF1343 family)
MDIEYIEGVFMNRILKIALDFILLIVAYFRFCYKPWRANGRKTLVVNTLMYVYLSLVLFVTLMPVVASLPGIFNHPYKPIPVRHGLTVGELACLFNNEFGIRCDLEVVPVEGWSRSLAFNETDLLWVSPSPNIPTFETALIYIGTCLLEGTNVSEGRGTTKPFELIGAPWIDPYDLSRILNDYGFDGALFRPAYFTPVFSKYQGQLCGGVQIHITDHKKVKAFEIGVKLIYTLMDRYKEHFAFLPPYKEGSPPPFDRLAGTDIIRLRNTDYKTMIKQFEEELEAFRRLKEKYHLYC